MYNYYKCQISKHSGMYVFLNIRHVKRSDSVNKFETLAKYKITMRKYKSLQNGTNKFRHKKT